MLFHSFRGQHVYEAPVQVNQETVGAMLPKLGELCTYDLNSLFINFSIKLISYLNRKIYEIA